MDNTSDHSDFAALAGRWSGKWWSGVQGTEDHRTGTLHFATDSHGGFTGSTVDDRYQKEGPMEGNLTRTENPSIFELAYTCQYPNEPLITGKARLHLTDTGRLEASFQDEGGASETEALLSRDS